MKRKGILEEVIYEGKVPSREEALSLYEIKEEELLDLFAAAHRLRLRYKGKKVNLCSIVNAKSGRCSEDCKFCAQSSHYQAEIAVYPLLSSEEIIESARAAKKAGAGEFGIVTSGKGLRDGSDLATIKEAINGVAAVGLPPCTSLGILERQDLKILQDSGLKKYHHNLETSRSFFPRICSTHDYEEDVNTIRAAKELGLYVCCGGIFGLGESREDRVELALTLAELDVDSVPMNFLNPIPKTPLALSPLLPALEILKTVAIYRLLLPQKDIIICGGRMVTLRDTHPLVLLAGANGLMTGNYLTTTGRDPALDRQMILDLGLELP
jgi:biotin synthase